MVDDSSERFVLLNHLAEEFAERYRRGERPALREYIDRYPELADDIRDCFPALAEMEQVKDDRQAPVESVVSPPLPPLEQLGDFRIIRGIGRGGMGVVYEAEQVSLGRHVALKVLPPQMLADVQRKRRFEREAKAAARLHHTNIVPVFGVGEHEGQPYYVMQFIQGLGLDEVLDELQRLQPAKPGSAGQAGPLTDEARVSRKDVSAADVARSLLTGRFTAAVQPASSSGSPPPGADAPGSPPETSSLSSSSVVLPGSGPASGNKQPTYWNSVAQIGTQVADALEYAHRQGIRHRDIKPSNLLLDTTGTVWVTDFGLAKADDQQNLTHTGDVLGTLRYMPPEAFDGKADARGDIYSLGLTLYELLAFRPAFDEKERNRLIKQVATAEPARLDRLKREVPRDLVTIVHKAIERDPAQRYATAAELAADLKRFLADEPIQARRQTQLERYLRWARHHPGMAVLGGVLTAVLVLVTLASLLAAGYFNRLRHRAETEKNRADVMLADMYTLRGLLAGERDAPAEAVLWFAAAAEQSAIAEDPQREEHNRLRARNWMRQATVPVAALSVSGQVDQLDFHPRGDLLLVRSAKGEVVFWSWRDGKRLPWAEKLAGVGAAQLSPDGAAVALGFLSGEAQIRKVPDGELLAQIPYPGSIKALAFSPDGKFLAVASDVARVWDVNGKAFLHPTWRHPQPIRAVLFNRKGDRLITACADKRARVFVVEKTQDRQEPLYAAVAHTVVTSPALIDADRLLVTVTGEAEITRWDLATGKPAGAPIPTRSPRLAQVVASPDGKWFVAGGDYGCEFHAVDARQSPVYLSHANVVSSFVFSRDNTMLLTVSWGAAARLWSLPSGQPLGQPLKHTTSLVDQGAWSPDARYVATAQNDGLVRVWQRPVDDLVIARQPEWGTRPRVSFDGRLFAPGRWHEAFWSDVLQNIGRLGVFATANGQAVGPDIPLPGVLIDSCVCGDNRAAAAVWSHGEKGQLGVWDVATARARFGPIALPGLPLAVAARPGSGQLAVICATGDLRVIDDQTGKSVLELRHEGWTTTNPPDRSTQVQYTPDGKAIVSLGGGRTATINVCDADSGQLRFAPLHPSVSGSWFRSFSVSADSRLLATMAVVKNVAQVWDLATGRALSEPLPHPGDFWGLFCVRFSPDGRYLLTGHADGQARYWDWQAARLVCPPMAHADGIYDVEITPDGRFGLTAVRGRTEVQVWELTMGRRIAPPLRLALIAGSGCHTLAITPDGRRALVAFMGPPSRVETDLAVVDLEALLSPSSTPTADLALLAELVTAQRIELGDLSALTTEQWQERWDRLRERNPDLVKAR